MVDSMKIIKHISLVTLLALLAGCATTFRPWKLSEVQEGMDKAQVVKILGEPDSVETKEGAELLHYAYSEDYNPTPASADVQPSNAATLSLRDQEIKKSLKEYKYVVKLVDGKVQTYKEIQE